LSGSGVQNVEKKEIVIRKMCHDDGGKIGKRARDNCNRVRARKALSLTTITEMPICTSCTYPIPYLYTVYESESNLRLEQCVRISNFKPYR